MPELKEWSRPVRTAEAERISLGGQARKIVKGEVPTDAERERVVRQLAGVLPPVPFDVGKLEAKARAAVLNLKATASPGYPYMRDAKTNEEYLNMVGHDHVVSLALERIKRLLAVPMEELKQWGPRRYVSEFLCDPRRVFGKNEVHSREKVAQGRLRLIFSVSIVDQLVERILNGALNQAAISNWEKIPPCPGMGLHDEGLAIVQAKIRAIRRPCGTDMRGWDFSVDQWMLDDDASVRSVSSGNSYSVQDSLWHRVSVVSGCSLLVLSDGSVVEQDVDHRGIMLSGRYITSSGNSNIRTMVKAHAFPSETLGVIAMGDDCVEELLPGVGAAELIAGYARLGVKVKEVEIHSAERPGVEFCSYRFDLDGGVSPVRWHKMLGTFLATWPALPQFQERYVALMRELRHSPERDRVRQLVRQVAVVAACGAQ